MSKGNWKKTFNALLSVSLVTSFILPSLSTPVKAATTSTDLIISEYIEGSGFNKAVEIYNGTGATVNLNDYTLELHINGAAAAAQKVELVGTLENNDTYVVYHKDANTAIKSNGDLENSSVVNFNGDDPIVLKNQVKSLIRSDKLVHKLNLERT